MTYICRFCDKICKNKNSLAQHEIRCKLNPNKIATNTLGDWSHKHLKGQTKETSEIVKKYSNSIKEKYKSGWSNGANWNKYKLNYVHQQHNNEELNKWFNYIKNKTVTIPKYTLVPLKSDDLDQYRYISADFKDTKLYFEHRYIMSFYIDLLEKNCVHHLDENKSNNNIYNLITFVNPSEHKRYHLSKYAWLIYDETTHLFSCIVKKI